jgi:hypothetical protein
MPNMSLHSIFWSGAAPPGGDPGHVEFNGIDSHSYWLRKLHVLLPLLWFLN